jgi:xanthine/CO dehydrogenase XdhC/CoxF family maturation factor
MSTESNYSAVLDAIAQQMKDQFADAATVRVVVEQDPTLGLPDDGGRALVVESMRRRPSASQSMAAGKRLRNRFSVVITAIGFDMTSFREAANKRDDLIDKVEQAVMADRSIGNRVANLEIVGGEFYRASNPNNAPPFASMAETILEMDVSAIS